MRRNTKTISILIVLSVIGIFIYKSPDESYWFKENSQDAIGVGRIYSFYLLNGYKQGLLKMSHEPAKTKIEELNFQRTAKGNIYDKVKEGKIDFDIAAPLFAGQEDEDMELIAFEKTENLIAMTFAYKNWRNIVEIPDKGKMLFSVGVRYYNPEDHRIAPKLVRKIANLPLLRNFTGQMGTTGRWVVFDYNYKYNLSDYSDWVLKEGENYSQKLRKESEELDQQLKDEKFRKEFDESFDKKMDILYEWVSVEVEEQIGRIERLDKVREEITGEQK